MFFYSRVNLWFVSPDSVIKLLTEENLLACAKTAARNEGLKYSAEIMADRFASGVEFCLLNSNNTTGCR